MGALVPTLCNASRDRLTGRTLPKPESFAPVACEGVAACEGAVACNAAALSVGRWLAGVLVGRLRGGDGG